jgi:hypothetical protein
LKLGGYSLTLKMLLLTAVVGLVVWGVSDTIQTHTLKTIFNSKLAERLSWQAEKQRIMFDRYVKGHHQAAKLFVKNQDLQQYVQTASWAENDQTQLYLEPPPWLPRLSVIRNFLQPGYISLLDVDGQVRELYQGRQNPPPAHLLQPDHVLLNLSHNQGFLTTLDDQPYLLASQDILDGQGHRMGMLLLAAPLDEQFLIASQGSAMVDTNVIALLSEGQPVILVSSNSALMPPGTRVDDLKDRRCWSKAAGNAG